MRAQLFALLTAVGWGVGGYFEKKGLHAGQLAPQVGITVRTGVALLVLAAVSAPQWHSLTRAGARSLVMLVVGGGLVAARWGCSASTSRSRARRSHASCPSHSARRSSAR